MELSCDFLSNVAGRKSIKKELKLIYDWFQNRRNYESKNVDVPKGILAYGFPGTGKTYVLKEFAKTFKMPIIEIDGASAPSSIIAIEQAFGDARNYDEAIIFIDELDLLIEKNPNAIRSLQVNMDGYKERGDIIVLATANHLHDIPEPLLRRGRFDLVIDFDIPSREDIRPLFEFYINSIGAESNVDYEYISNFIVQLTCSDIVAIVNDAFLRSDCGIITTEAIEQSYNIIALRSYNETRIIDEKERYYCAVHEASHCVMMYKYDKYHKIYRASIMKTEERCGEVMSSVDEFATEESVIAHIDISLAGAIGTKLIIGKTDMGCSFDITNAHIAIEKLVNDCGYKGIQNTLKRYKPFSRKATIFRCYDNEKIIKKILKQRKRVVSKYLRQNKRKISEIAGLLMRKGALNRQEIIDILK